MGESVWNQLRSRVASNQWMEVRYEDLIFDTKMQLERICTFIGVEYSENVFDYVKDSTYRAPDARQTYQWKTGMRKHDLQRLEYKLREGLLKRRYELSGHPTIQVSELTKKGLYLQSRIKALFFRLARYGILLTMQETLSRRLGLDKAHRQAAADIARIDDAHLQ